MASKKPVMEEVLEEAPKKKKGKMMLIIIIAVVVLLLGGGAAYYFLVMSKSNDEHAEEVQVKEKPEVVVFLPLDPFTVNLVTADDRDAQFLQVAINLKLSEDSDAQLIKKHMPEVRNRILMVLTSKSPADINSEKGKRALLDEISAELRKPLTKKDTVEHLTAVLFTSFIIQ
jgi:flagellar FliL protein